MKTPRRHRPLGTRPRLEPAPPRGPLRRLLRGVLLLIGLAVLVAVPVMAFRIFRTQIITTVSGPSRAALRLVGGSNVQETLLDLYLRLQQVDLDAPAGDDPTPVTFTIHPGETAAQIAQRLEEEGLIRDADAFRALLRLRGVDTRLEAGNYELRRTMSMNEIMAALQHGRPPTVRLTVPEGWRAEEIANLLRVVGLADPDEFLQIVRSGGNFDYDFLRDRPAGVTSLEGFLFPDTYEFPTDATARDVVQRMLETFGRRFTPELRAQARKQGLSVYQAVTLASIVEREAVIPDERPLIASVFLNRLRKGMYLNADPTVQYALGYQKQGHTWWKRPLLLEDLDVDSPYNTYRHPGLPPGPICNPGLDSLKAVANPAHTDYYYFVANDVAGDGSHVFAKTLEEHQANIKKYRR